MILIPWVNLNQLIICERLALFDSDFPNNIKVFDARVISWVKNYFIFLIFRLDSRDNVNRKVSEDCPYARIRVSRRSFGWVILVKSFYELWFGLRWKWHSLVIIFDGFSFQNLGERNVRLPFSKLKLTFDFRSQPRCSIIWLAVWL